MTIHSESYVEQKVGRNSNVLIARYDVQDETGNREAGHKACNPDERTNISLKQCGIDKQLRKIRLRQADRSSQETDERYTCQPLPVRKNEAKRTLILLEPDPRSFDRHFLAGHDDTRRHSVFQQMTLTDRNAQHQRVSESRSDCPFHTLR